MTQYVERLARQAARQMLQHERAQLWSLREHQTAAAACASPG